MTCCIFEVYIAYLGVEGETTTNNLITNSGCLITTQDPAAIFLRLKSIQGFVPDKVLNYDSTRRNARKIIDSHFEIAWSTTEGGRNRIQIEKSLSPTSLRQLQ